LLYDAFISYSHAADGKLAPAIQGALHSFIRPWYKLRALHIFRDKTSLSANPALWPSIEEALSQSRWFLFMASPQAAQSIWVQKELAWWLEHGDKARMLIVLTDGLLLWDNDTSDFNWDRTTALPRLLAKRFEHEPAYVDFAWARSEGNLSLRHLHFRACLLDIAAALHDKPKDELDGADVQQFKRNRRWAWSAASALATLTLVSAATAYVAMVERNSAIARQAAAQASLVLRDDPNQLERAGLLSAYSLRRSTSVQSDAVARQVLALLPIQSTRFQVAHQAAKVGISSDRRYIALGQYDGKLALADTKAKSLIGTIDTGVSSVAMDPSGKGFVVGTDNGAIELYDFALKRVRRIATLQGRVWALAVDRTGVFVAAGTEAGQLSVSRMDSEQPLWSAQTPVRVRVAAFSADSTIVGFGSEDGVLQLVDAQTGRSVLRHSMNGIVAEAAFSSDGQYVSAGTVDTYTARNHSGA
jgi:hypothetical protein